MEQRLVASSRADAGKGVARKLRAAGSVPGVLYGHDTAPVQIAVDARDLSRVLHTSAGANVLVDLVVDGKEHLAMPREVQRDRIHDLFLHVDFLAVSRTEKVTVTVPIRLIGTAVGVKEGGILDHHLWEVSVSCLPGDVPEHVDADGETLRAMTAGEKEEVGQQCAFELGPVCPARREWHRACGSAGFRCVGEAGGSFASGHENHPRPDPADRRRLCPARR